MRTEIEYRFGYFLQLEQMAKVALASYAAVLFAGTLITILGVDSIIGEWTAGSYRSIILSLFGVVGIFIGIFALAEKICWIGKFNAWLDKKFWGILGQSNGVLSHTILQSIGFPAAHAASFFDANDKDSATQNIFRKLAGEDNIFQFLLDTNIFRLWMLYWMFLYGSLTFSILTVGFFLSFLLTMAPITRMCFVTSWILALFHIALGFLLGKYLVRMTRSTARIIASSYANEIVGMLGTSAVQTHQYLNEG